MIDTSKMQVLVPFPMAQSAQAAALAARGLSGALYEIHQLLFPGAPFEGDALEKIKNEIGRLQQSDSRPEQLS